MDRQHDYPDCTTTHTPSQLQTLLQTRHFQAPTSHLAGFQIEIPHHKQPWTFLGCPASTRLAPRATSGSGTRLVQAWHTDALIVAVDGACRGNHLPAGAGGRQAGCGVYFHDRSPYNQAFRLNAVPGVALSSQKAELNACVEALGIVGDLASVATERGQWQASAGFGPLKTVVVKSDSRYLVHGVTEWMEGWVRWDGAHGEKGFMTAGWEVVSNGDLFRKIEEFVLQLNALGIAVKFWAVERDRNREADALANAALNGVSWQTAITRLRTRPLVAMGQVMTAQVSIGSVA